MDDTVGGGGRRPALSARHGDPLFQLAILPGAVAPAVGSFVVRRWVTGEGFADAGLRPRLRRGWPYYLFALLWPLVVAVVIIALATALGLGRPDFSALRVTGELAPGADVPSDAAQVGRSHLGASAVFVYLLSAVWFLIAGAQVTPPTVLAGMVLLVISGACIAWSVLSRPSAAQTVGGIAAQPRVR